MDTMALKVCGKVNLTLDVVGKREDGYHNVEMIMQSIELWDRVILKKSHKDIVLTTNMPGLSCDSSNIAWRAAQLIKTKCGITQGVDIALEKSIPMAAGMAGGSADCAGVLLGLNLLWELGLDFDQLGMLAKSLGADVPFCLMGGTALAQGIGDILTPIKSKEDIWLVVVKPDFGVSTRDVYEGLKLDGIKQRPNNTRVIEYLELGQIEGVASSLVNVLEGVTIPMYPVISNIKQRLLDSGALGSSMSGSGPSVYGIFKDQNSAHCAADILRKMYDGVFAIKTTQRGIYIE